MRALASLVLMAGLLLGGSGCVTAPRSVEVNVGHDRPPPVDSRRVPQPATLEEARGELDKAYQNIQYLERENERLAEKADKYKRERDDARHQLKKYQKD